MSMWHIVMGASSEMCVVPDGELSDGRKIYYSFECDSLLDAIKVLKQYEDSVLGLLENERNEK